MTDLAQPTALRSPRYLIATLVYSALMVSLVSSLGAPLVPTIAAARHVSLTDAQWVLTVTLIVGAVGTPLLGRLGDGGERRHVLIGGLAVVTLGLLVASASSTFAMLLVGRALQGIGVGLVPLTFAIARQFIPADRLRSTIAILSVTAATGVGLGYYMTGLIADAFSYRVAFGVAAVLAAAATFMAWAAVPSSIPERTVGVDWGGAAMLAIALGTLLLALSEGDQWHWSSPSVLGLIAVAVVFGVAWVVFEHRLQHPLVELKYLRVRNVFVANVVAILLSFGMFIALTLVIRLVQTPASAGYGFHVSTATTGLLIMPLSIATLVSSRAAVVIGRRFSQSAVMVTGALAVTVGMLLLALHRNHLGEVCVSMALLGVGVGMTYAAMPALIMRAVPVEETGSATGLNQTMRIVGGSLGSALGATLLAAQTTPGSGLPRAHGFTLTFLIAAGVTFVAAVAATKVKEVAA